MCLSVILLMDSSNKKTYELVKYKKKYLKLKVICGFFNAFNRNSFFSRSMFEFHNNFFLKIQPGVSIQHNSSNWSIQFTKSWIFWRNLTLNAFWRLLWIFYAKWMCVGTPMFMFIQRVCSSFCLFAIFTVCFGPLFLAIVASFRYKFMLKLPKKVGVFHIGIPLDGIVMPSENELVMWFILRTHTFRSLFDATNVLKSNVWIFSYARTSNVFRVLAHF